MCALLLGTGCLGPGHATGRLYKWNSSFEGKWSKQGMFIVCLPGYIVTSIGDNLIFNSWQWWTGENPVDPPESNQASDFGL
jgi:hypothetical protein